MSSDSGVIHRILTSLSKFYYADERQTDGGVSIPVDGPAAADAYLDFAEEEKQSDWE